MGSLGDGPDLTWVMDIYCDTPMDILCVSNIVVRYHGSSSEATERRYEYIVRLPIQTGTGTKA